MDPIALVIRNLKTYYPDVPISSKVPNPRPAFFFRVDQGAPRRINLVQYQTLIIVQAYGDDLDQLFDALVGVTDVLENMDHLDPLVSGIEEITGPVENPDDQIQQQRWQVTCQLYHTIC